MSPLHLSLSVTSKGAREKPHSTRTASFFRLPSCPSLLSPPLRWRTIDLRNEVGLLSRIYTRFSLCLSDRFHSVRHSLSLWIFMLVRSRQRTQEQVEDVFKLPPRFFIIIIIIFWLKTLAGERLFLNSGLVCDGLQPLGSLWRFQGSGLRWHFLPLFY